MELLNTIDSLYILTKYTSYDFMKLKKNISEYKLRVFECCSLCNVYILYNNLWYNETTPTCISQHCNNLVIEWLTCFLEQQTVEWLPICVLTAVTWTPYRDWAAIQVYYLQISSNLINALVRMANKLNMSANLQYCRLEV